MYFFFSPSPLTL